MSYAKGTGPTPTTNRHSTTTEPQESAAMMQAPDGAGLSVPIQASRRDVAEERIEVAGGSQVHVNDVLCGRGKISFNHSE